MKKIEEVFNLEKLQASIDDGIDQLRNDYPGIYDNQYIISTIVSGQAGQYSLKEFCSIFDLRYYKEDDFDLDLDFDYFERVTEALKKHVSIPDGYDLYIGWDENDGSIEISIFDIEE